MMDFLFDNRYNFSMHKKLFLLFLFINLFYLNVFAKTFNDVGIAKYAVLEVKSDNCPIREKDNENAKRLTHLYKNAILFADKQNDHYYRVELKENDYAFVNKKFVEVQAIIPEKRIQNIENISFKETKNKYQLKFELPELSAFMFKENGKKLMFTLFDNRFDPTEIQVSGLIDKFSLPGKIDNNFELEYKNEKLLFGYDVEKYEKGYILSVKKPPKVNPKKPLKNIKIVVDPGHGGVEKGACAFDLEEKTINLEISKKLRNELKKKGAKVFLTRTKDKQVGLYERTVFAKEKDADILISIHQNSLPDRRDIVKKYGTGTYYYHSSAKPLAEAIKNNLVIATDFRDDGVNYASFVLNRPTSPVSVLVECGYIIRKEEAEKLSDKKFQKIIAKAITKGIEDYLAENFAE